MWEAVAKFLDVFKLSGWQSGMIAAAAGLFLYLSHVGVLPPLESWIIRPSPVLRAAERVELRPSSYSSSGSSGPVFQRLSSLSLMAEDQKPDLQVDE